jgi:hypothetical protein
MPVRFREGDRCVQATDGSGTLENAAGRSPAFGVHPAGLNSAWQSAISVTEIVSQKLRSVEVGKVEA